MRGTFVERDRDPHVALREALLNSGRRLPPPREPVVRVAAADLVTETPRQLQAHGLFLGALDTLPEDEDFILLGTSLGELIPETDPAVQVHVSRDVLLNLVSVHAETDDVSLQPFATGPLTLHSEGSGRPVAGQPRYIVLMCCDPGAPAARADGREPVPGQTVLIPMAAVHEALTPAHRDILRATRYRTGQAVPTVLREVDGRPVFSFRDFGSSALEWESDAAGVTESDVDDAFRALLAAMYAPERAGAVHWARGTLAAIDNTYFFHGRTSGATQQPGSRRHLKRLRIRTARHTGER
ncbi:TauD/TfdA family dioxygenase [Streptantibioticus parmotrematis]|uniref:TauD/TfdA family dioxygenase n=1 Tax=Streptantibioticus parmotrematis TaxID=2873249 RepID=UPI0033F76FBE